MEFFAFIYTNDLEANKQAYIWFNRKEHHLSSYTIAVPQAAYQHDTEMRLVQEVRKSFPTATVITDTANPGEYRCIKL